MVASPVQITPPTVRQRVLAWSAALSIGAGLGSPFMAQASDLDASFGINGFAVTAFDGGASGAAAVAVQPDGKIVAAGSAYAPATKSDFALVRYNPDGSIDTTFGPGANGTVTSDFHGSGDSAQDVKLQPDGKIVAVGSAFLASTDFALIRYNSDGTLDSTFGAGGKVTTDFAGGTDEAFALELQPDGKIVVAGSSGAPQGGLALARYNPDGSLDTTFGAAGTVTTGSLLAAGDVILQSDGKIVAAGAVYNYATGTDDFALARYDASGNLDATFGTGGVVVTDFQHATEVISYQGTEIVYRSGNDHASAAALQADGQIIVAGYSADIQGTYFALARYRTDGSLDTGLGDNGKVMLTFGSTTDWDTASDVAIQPDGKIIVAGIVGGGIWSATPADIGLARLRPSGRLDKSFGDKGQLVSDYNNTYNTASAITLQPDDKIVIAGAAGGNFAVSRYQSGGRR